MGISLKKEKLLSMEDFDRLVEKHMDDRIKGHTKFIDKFPKEIIIKNNKTLLRKAQNYAQFRFDGETLKKERCELKKHLEEDGKFPILDTMKCFDIIVEHFTLKYGSNYYSYCYDDIMVAKYMRKFNTKYNLELMISLRQLNIY